MRVSFVKYVSPQWKLEEDDSVQVNLVKLIFHFTICIFNLIADFCLRAAAYSLLILRGQIYKNPSHEPSAFPDTPLRQVVPPNWYVATMTKVKRENRKLFSKVSIVLIIALPLHFPQFLCPIQPGAAMAVAAGNWGRQGGVAVVEPESRHNTSSNTIRSSLKCILSFCCESDDAEVG